MYILQVCRCTVVQVCSCTGVQEYMCLGVQAYKCAGVQVCSCTGVQVSVACLLSPTERRTHTPDTPSAHTTRCAVATTAGRCAGVTVRLFSTARTPTHSPLCSARNDVSRTSSVPSVFLLPAVRLTRKVPDRVSSARTAQLQTAFTLCHTPCTG